jgi:serine/threonine protein kinase
MQWMAPEVLTSRQPSKEADIYSFGMVIWECCAKLEPFSDMRRRQASTALQLAGSSGGEVSNS